MRILGVDPGTHRTGVGVIESQGNRYRMLHAEVIAPAAKLSLPQRLFKIHEALRIVIAEFRPEAVAIENVFYGKDLQAMVKIGEARACAMLAASEEKVPVIEYAPARIKQSVSGNGRATKEQVQHMVKTLLSLSAIPQSDSADALAVALCHLHTGTRKLLPSSLLARQKEGG